MSVNIFLENKQREALENEAFIEWNKDNVLSDDDDYPLVVFHGSTTESFDIVDFEKICDESYCGKGFYTSSSIKDVNNNYATAKINNKKEEYMAGDLNSRMGIFEDRMQHAGNTFVEEFFENDEVGELAEDLELTPEHFEDIKDGEYFEIAKESCDEEGLLDWKKFIKNISKSLYVENEGWVTALYIKMTKPVYYTTDVDATYVTIQTQEMQKFKIDNEYLFDYFENTAYELMDYLTELNNGEHIDFFDKEEFISAITQHFGDYTEHNGKEVFDHIIELIEDNEYDFEVDIDMEDISKKVEDIFIDNYLINCDEPEEEERDLEFIDIVFFDNNVDQKEIDLYLELKNNCIMHSEQPNDMIDFFAMVEADMRNEDNRVSLYSLFKKIKSSDYVESFADYNNVISVIFDGIVLDAEDANNEWQMKNIAYGSKHYIVFNENNVKSAIGNNGKYSLYDNDMCARRAEDINTDKINKLTDNILDNLSAYKEKYGELINVSLEQNSRLFSNNEKAIMDRTNNNLYLNLNNINNELDLSRTISHEIIGHKGLDLLLGKNKNKFLEKVSNKYHKKDYKDIEQLYPELDYGKKNDRLKMTEEKICIYAENKYKHDKYMNKVVNSLKYKAIKFKKLLGLKDNIEDTLFSVIHESNLNIEKELKNQKKSKRKLF
jgi:hypothetical protein